MHFIFYSYLCTRNKGKSCADIGIWCNGNTTDSGPVILGSSPSIPTNEKVQQMIVAPFCVIRHFILIDYVYATAHAQMMEAIIDYPGRYRHSGVGVFSEQGLVHMAPPADRVPYLMEDLFAWLRQSNDHLLIRSCVFHYEFEFIHPFADGNGRMGRLWQSLILGKLHPLFEHLSVENMVFSNQQAYYDAITASTQAADSGVFIDFMLSEILETLKNHQGEDLNDVHDKEKIVVSWHDMIVSSHDTVVSCHDTIVSSCAVIAEYVKGGVQIRMLTVSFIYIFLR